MNTYWITSDTHFNHEKVKEYCGRPDNFESLIQKGLSAIPAKDVLIHLGDVCIGRDEYVHSTYIEPLLCTKILVRGNHDKKSGNWYLDHGWDLVVDYLGLEAFGKSLLFSHVPKNMRDFRFDVNVHGHLHNEKFRDRQFCEDAPEKYILYAQELRGYKPVKLTSLLK